MIAMQYKISLPDDYPMDITKKGIQDNGAKAPGFSSHFSQSTGRVMFYHPDKWNCTEFHFFEQLPAAKPHAKFYRILHISM